MAEVQKQQKKQMNALEQMRAKKREAFNKHMSTQPQQAQLQQCSHSSVGIIVQERMAQERSAFADPENNPQRQISQVQMNTMMQNMNVRRQSISANANTATKFPTTFINDQGQTEMVNQPPPSENAIHHDAAWHNQQRINQRREGEINEPAGGNPVGQLMDVQTQRGVIKQFMTCCFCGPIVILFISLLVLLTSGKMSQMYECDKHVFTVGILYLVFAAVEFIRILFTVIYCLYVSKTPQKHFAISNVIFWVLWIIVIPTATIYSTVIITKATQIEWDPVTKERVAGCLQNPLMQSWIIWCTIVPVVFGWILTVVLVCVTCIIGCVAWTAYNMYEGHMAEQRAARIPMINDVLDLFKKNKKKYKDTGKEGESCVICMVNFESESDVIGLVCGHTFCAECLQMWIETQGQSQDMKCPTCRTPVAI